MAWQTDFTSYLPDVSDENWGLSFMDVAYQETRVTSYIEHGNEVGSATNFMAESDVRFDAVRFNKDIDRYDRAVRKWLIDSLCVPCTDHMFFMNPGEVASLEDERFVRRPDVGRKQVCAVCGTSPYDRQKRRNRRWY